MFDANESTVLGLIGPDDLVLDVGGWARCFNRANSVLDFRPYESHGHWYLDHFGLAAQGGEVEHFTAETWIERDICDREPWPFPDRFFDFCICSHTLEDLRDPLWACSEMKRVARRGYIEVPSIAFEISRGREPGVPVGLSHHRWIVDVNKNKINFMCKFHNIHGDLPLNLPARVWRGIPDDEMVAWLFWEGDFACRETELWHEIAEVVRRYNPSGIRDEEEADRLKAELAEARGELARARRLIEGLEDRLRIFECSSGDLVR